MDGYIIKYQGQRVHAVELYRKQYHQIVLWLSGDLGPFRHGQTVMINLNTMETVLIEEDVA